MRSGIVGFILGGVLVFLGLAFVQYLVIRVSADDLTYRFSNYVFSDSEFPWGDFEQGRVIRRCLFPVKTTVTFYNAQYQEVTRADKPGRYGAVVRTGLNGGVVVHQFITLYRTPVKIFWDVTPIPISSQLPPEIGLNPAVLHNQELDISWAIRRGLFAEGGVSPDLAILLAGLSETSPDDPPAVNRTNVFARDADWWFGLRQRLGLAEKYPYLVDLPHGYDSDPGKRWPLILFLHGGNEKGKNLQPVRESGLAGLIARGKQIPAIVISPQCPWGEDWNALVLSQLLDEVSVKYRVDPDRIYVTGVSSGGNGTWDLALAHPERFAAIVPIAAGSDLADSARIKDIPIWAFQGEKDTTIAPGEMVTLANVLRQAGGHPHLTVFPLAGHQASWDQAYGMDALYTWLLAQKRGQPEVVTPGVPTP
jgi:acetyl esterase/lipase